MFSLNKSTDTKLAVLEERLSSYEVMMKKIDEAIQLMGQTSQNISKMLAVHNEKIEQCGKADVSITAMIEGMKKENKEDHEKVNKRIDELESKLEDVSRIKWITVGIGIVLTALAGSFATLAAGWWTPFDNQQIHTHQNYKQ
jgi:hypothetical protein